MRASRRPSASLLPASSRSSRSSSANAIVLLVASLLLASCAHYSPVYWGWGEWAAAADDAPAALVDWSTVPGVVTAIDGQAVGAGYKRARLRAGHHLLAYAYETAQFGEHPRGTISLGLAPGHAYELRIKLCFWCRPRRFAVWVDDTATGEAVWGNPPDWPAWFL